jgi:flagellar hook assembly protein FlgD
VPGSTPPDTGSGSLQVRIGTPYPLPARGYTSFVYDLSRSARVELVIYDERGRVVRRLVDPRNRQAGPNAEVWDGSDDHGTAVRPGVYFARLIVNGTAHALRVPLIR